MEKLILITMLALLSSCTFFGLHPNILKDAEEVVEEIVEVESGCPDLKEK